MKYLLSLIFCLSIASCTKETELAEDFPIKSSQYNETDFNFVLRAIHPNQMIEISLPDGSKEKGSFQGTILVFKDGKVEGHAKLNSARFGWRYTPESATFDCIEGLRIIKLVVLAEETNERRIPHHIRHRDRAFIDIQPSDSNTDSPECLIWDIKDGDGHSTGKINPEGNIFIDNSSCRGDRI